jgi:hypothetical protein
VAELEDDTPREKWLVDLGEKTRVDATALAGNPFDRKQDWRSTFRATGRRGLVAAAMAIAVLALAWNLRPASDTSRVPFDVVNGTVRVTAPDPRALEQQIVADLASAGVQANGYEQLGIIGIDADLPRPLTAEARAVLDKHRLAAPANGVLRIEIAKQD